MLFNANSTPLLKHYLFLVVVIFVSHSAIAQDTIQSKKDFQKSTENKTSVTHSVRKAVLLSTILPGGGQAYNHKYWKIPVIYAAFGGLTYLLITNNVAYNKYKQAYIYRTDSDVSTISDPAFDKYSNENILTLKNAYNRSRDFNIICIAGIYFLNIVDAAVDAHLFTFDVNENLSLKLQPEFMFTAFNKLPVSGLSVNLKF